MKRLAKNDGGSLELLDKKSASLIYFYVGRSSPSYTDKLELLFDFVRGRLVRAEVKVIVLYALVLSNANHWRQNVRRPAGKSFFPYCMQ